jgi:ABC-type lipoprotein release transport system permease subunit
MHIRTLLRRSLFFHWRGNLAIVLGVAVGTAVLTGALLVGDSLRGSLRDRALRQIGWVEEAMVSGRFVRQQLAKDLNDRDVVPGITLRAMVERPGADGTAGPQISGVTVWAARDAWVSDPPLRDLSSQLDWWIWKHLPGLRRRPQSPPSVWVMPLVKEGEVFLAPSVARRLGVNEHDSIAIRVPKFTNIPRESLLGRRGTEDTAQRLTITVGGIFTLTDDDPATDLSLAPGIQQPLNVFVNLKWLQEQIGEPDRVNVLMAAGHSAGELQERLREHLTLDDWGLTLHAPKSQTDALFAALGRPDADRLTQREWQGRIAEAVVKAADTDGDGTLTRDKLLAYYRRRGYFSLESRQLLIEPAVERAVLDVAKDMGLRAAPTLVYLANSIGDGTNSFPYSVVAALDPQLPPPLGPFLPNLPNQGANAPRSPEQRPLADDEILLAAWPASRLKVQPGDTITLTFFDPEQEGRLTERTATFRLRGFVPLEGVGADPDLTPAFPGITDKLGLRDWDPPFPYDNTRIQRRDEDYWRQYRTTPKAYISLAAGRKLFGSRFGDLTSIRLAPPPASGGRQPPGLEDVAQEFSKRLLAHLRPEQGGFVFEDVRARALRASGGGLPFDWLFLGFSCFLIAAALVLVGLLVRLNLDRRASEVGLLLATGYRPRTVRRLLLAEGLSLAAFGGLLGLAGAVGYAALMLRLLALLWPEGSVGSFLELHVTGMSLLIGYVAALLVGGLTIWWAVRILGRVAPSALLAGVTTPDTGLSEYRPGRWRKRLSVAGLVLAVGLIVGGAFVHEVEARAGMFFSGGMLLLAVALAAVWGWLKRPSREPIHPGEPAALARLGVRNAARNPVRSLLTAALLASAAFLLVAVESFRRSPEADFAQRTGGSGGFALVGESDLPLYQDPQSREGRQELLDALEKKFQKNPETKLSRLDATRKLLESTTILPLRLRAGDDASCLNLYQPGRPRLLGAPRALIERGGFHFADTEAHSPEDRANPWRLLDEPTADGAIPVFGEVHPVQWMLKSGLGGTIEVPDGQGNPVKLRFVGLLQDSVFQSELLMSEANFLRLFPRQEGFSYFLIDSPPGRTEDVRSLLETALEHRGFAATPAREKLAAYLAVENTYLSTFQVLGGFGLLLGALGLAVVLLRNVWERRGELALLRALGYRHRALGWLVFAENAALLLLGLGAGVGSAALAVAPHVLVGEGAVPWARLIGLLVLVLAVGLAAGGLAVRSTLRAPLVPALRRE